MGRPSASVESEVDVDLRTFVFQLFEQVGGELQEAGEECWRVELSPAIAHAIGVPPTFAFTFSAERVGATTELLTLGSPFVDQLVQFVRRQGVVGNLIALDTPLRSLMHGVAAADPWRRESAEHEGELMRSLAQRASTFRCRNARQRLLSQRLLFHRLACFYFCVALCSDEKQELLIGVAVDPLTEKVVEPPAMERTVSLPSPNWGNRGRSKREAASGGTTRGAGYMWERLYRRACEHLEQRIAPTLRHFRAEAERRMSNEVERLEAYYRGMASEVVDPLRQLFRRMARAEVRAGLSTHTERATAEEERIRRLSDAVRRLETRHREQLRWLENERDWRLAELREKYSVRVEVRLVQAAILHVPRIEWRLRLTGASRREVDVIHDVGENRLLDPACDGCGTTLSEFDLCRCEAAICSRCGPECPECGEAIPEEAVTPHPAKGPVSAPADEEA